MAKEWSPDLNAIEAELKELTDARKTIETSRALMKLLQMIKKYELLEGVKLLLQAKIEQRNSTLLSTLYHTPRSIQKPIQRPTRIENANQKTKLLLSHIEEFREKLKKLNNNKYMIYSIERKDSPIYNYMWGHTGGKFLWYKFSLRTIQEEKQKIMKTMQELKYDLEMIAKTIDLLDPKIRSEDSKKFFDEQKDKIYQIEETLIQTYYTFASHIIPNHIAEQVNVEEIYKENTITPQIQEYFNGKYGLAEEDIIPPGIDTNTTNFQENNHPDIKKAISSGDLQKSLSDLGYTIRSMGANPVMVKHIDYLLHQYPLYEYLSYPNPDYPKAQELRKKYIQ
jgi:hypothetical protein